MLNTNSSGYCSIVVKLYHLRNREKLSFISMGTTVLWNVTCTGFFVWSYKYHFSLWIDVCPPIHQSAPYEHRGLLLVAVTSKNRFCCLFETGCKLEIFCVVLLAVGKFQQLFLCLVVHVRDLLTSRYLSTECCFYSLVRKKVKWRIFFSCVR